MLPPGSPPPAVRWLHNETLMGEERNGFILLESAVSLQEIRSELVLTNLSQTMSGVYTCKSPLSLLSASKAPCFRCRHQQCRGLRGLHQPLGRPVIFHLPLQLGVLVPAPPYLHPGLLHLRGFHLQDNLQASHSRNTGSISVNYFTSCQSEACGTK